MTELYNSKENKRLQVVVALETQYLESPVYPLGFIKSKGLLMEFATQSNYFRGKHYINKKNSKGKFAEYYDDRYKNLDEIEYKGEKYYAGVEMIGKGIDEEEYYVIYKELPRIYDDETLHWRENVKYGVKETSIVSGVFEFHIIIKESGDAYIQVKYAKCENKHRNKVTIADIVVYNADNEAIIKAIKDWKEEFKNELEVA